MTITSLAPAPAAPAPGSTPAPAGQPGSAAAALFGLLVDQHLGAADRPGRAPRRPGGHRHPRPGSADRPGRHPRARPRGRHRRPGDGRPRRGGRVRRGRRHGRIHPHCSRRHGAGWARRPHRVPGGRTPGPLPDRDPHPGRARRAGWFPLGGVGHRRRLRAHGRHLLLRGPDGPGDRGSDRPVRPPAPRRPPSRAHRSVRRGPHAVHDRGLRRGPHPGGRVHHHRRRDRDADLPGRGHPLRGPRPGAPGPPARRAPRRRHLPPHPEAAPGRPRRGARHRDRPRPGGRRHAGGRRPGPRGAQRGLRPGCAACSRASATRPARWSCATCPAVLRPSRRPPASSRPAPARARHSGGQAFGHGQADDRGQGFGRPTVLDGGPAGREGDPSTHLRPSGTVRHQPSAAAGIDVTI